MSSAFNLGPPDIKKEISMTENTMTADNMIADNQHKSIIITGAGSGIGRATARTFLRAGYHVGLIGRREGPLVETAEGSEKALVLQADVSEPDAVHEVFLKAHQQFGRLDVLFNNAGVGTPPKTIDEISIDEWLTTVNINLNGAFFCAREAFAIMKAQSPQGGRIINNGSISAHRPRPGSVPYTSTKHAISGLTKSLSLDGRAFNIACGQIDIGNALTEMAHAMTIGVPQADGSIKAEPTMDVEEVATAVLSMAELPLSTNILSMTIMANDMPFIGRG